MSEESLSTRNLRNMKRFAQELPDDSIWQQSVAKLQWRSILTLGLLLVREKNRTVVEYSLSGFNNPIGVADWQNEFDMTAEDIKANLPTIEEIENEMRLLDLVAAEEDGDGDD